MAILLPVYRLYQKYRRFIPHLEQMYTPPGICGLPEQFRPGEGTQPPPPGVETFRPSQQVSGALYAKTLSPSFAHQPSGVGVGPMVAGYCRCSASWYWHQSGSW